MIQRTALGIVLVLTATVVGCDDDRFDFRRPVVESSATLFSLERSENLGFSSAIDFHSRQGRGPRTVDVEAPGEAGRWDIAVTERDGALVFAPVGVFGETQREAAIRVDPTRTFEEVTEAPEDTTGFRSDTTVPVRTDAVYIVRTRPPGSRSFFFSKLQPTAIDREQGSVTFDFLHNPNAGDRALERSEAEE